MILRPLNYFFLFFILFSVWL